MYGYERCDRCQKDEAKHENRWKSPRRGLPVTLMGERHAILCPECRNEWTQRMQVGGRDHEAYRRASHAETIETAAVARGDEETALRASEETMRARKAVHEIAAAFVAEPAECQTAVEDDE